MNITKIDNKTISVAQTISTNYDYSELLRRRDTIKREIGMFTEMKQKELDEVENLIKEAEKLGIK
jgi:hypothetical protein